MKRLIVLLSLLTLSCSPAGPLGKPGADQVISRSFSLRPDEKLYLYSAAGFFPNAYGYNGFVMQNPTAGGVILGVIACTTDRVLFGAWDDEEQVYVETLSIPYETLKGVSIKQFALTKRLLLTTTDRGYFTFEVTSSSIVNDGPKTVQLRDFLKQVISARETTEGEDRQDRDSEQ